MTKLLTVALHEYLYHLRRKSFFFATFGLPLLLVVGIGVLTMVSIRVGVGAEEARALGYVDQAGLLGGAQERFTDLDGQAVPVTGYPDEASARQALERGAINAYFVVPADYVARGQVVGYALEHVPILARWRFERLLTQALLQQVPEHHPRLEWPIAQLQHRQQRPTPQPGAANAGNTLGVIIFTVLFLWTTFSASGYLIQSLVEEKSNRVLEVLASSLKPEELMGGKIVGLGLLGLTQLAVWLSGGIALLLVAARYRLLPGGLDLPWGSLLLLVALFLGGYLLYAATLSAIGAAISATQEGGQLAGVVTVLAIMPMWFANRLLEQPHSLLALALSLFPFTTPLTLAIRSSSTDLPTWQIVLALLLLLGTALSMVWVAGQMMRLSMRLTGQRIGLRQLLRGLRGR